MVSTSTYKKAIQVFEHQFLAIDDLQFKQWHWRQLGVFNESNGGHILSLHPNGVKFKQFVGVIQVEELTIEILPKIGSTGTTALEKKKWQGVLVDMLDECLSIKTYRRQKASLEFQVKNVLEIYLEVFLEQCETLANTGLVSKYKRIETNTTSLKGKLIVPKHIQHNFVHKQRFYSSYSVYSKDNRYNQILLKALNAIPKISGDPSLHQRVVNLRYFFPEPVPVTTDATTFDKLVFDRKTESYKEPLAIAKMILLNLRPNVIAGQNNVFSLLFDMNRLWETYITVQIRKACHRGWKVEPQRSLAFWTIFDSNDTRYLKPDIVVSDHCSNVFVIDTKWKVPKNDKPDDGDLQQLFAYNFFRNANNSVLLYPSHYITDRLEVNNGNFIGTSLQCGVAKISVIDKMGRLDRDIGQKITTYMKSFLEPR